MKLVVWGGHSQGKESHRWVHRGFFNTALALGRDALWVNDTEASRQFVQPGDTVISADIYGHHIPYVPGVRYVLHNYDGSHPLCRRLEDHPENLLRLQVWTKDATGEDWHACRRFDRQARTLFQPWGVDRRPGEFLKPIFNPSSRQVVFVGAVWSDQYRGVELGNERVIEELRDACTERGLDFVHLTQVSDEAQVAACRVARLTPAFAGGWQVQHGYIPCRLFKLPAYGCLAFTNVPEANRIFDGYGPMPWATVAGALDIVLDMDEAEYTRIVRIQQEKAAGYTYAENLLAIDRALEEIAA